MKPVKLPTVLLFLFLIYTFSLTFSQTTLQTVDFETAGGYTTSVAEYLTSNAAYYTRLNYATNSSSISTPAPYTNYQGSWIFVMEDTGGPTETQTMTLSSVSISGYTSLKVKVLVAGQNNTAGTLETNKHMSFYANIDGGGDVLIGSFRGNGASSYLYKDDNLSGSIEGGETTVLTAAFTEYTFNISGTGSNMVISTKCLLSTVNEEGAYDNIRVLGTSAPTETPPSVTTTATSSINTTTATGNGSITATGGANATNRGVIWYAYSNTDKIIGDAGVTNVSETGTYGVAAYTASLTGLAVNTRYNASAHATNSAGTSYGSRVDFWTLANVPAAPTVNNATSTTLDVAINVNSNPTGTEFAIQETSGNLYVQANGTLGASAVWQTNSNWGTKTVTGLTAGTSYTFKVKARNGANTETAFSATTSLSTKTPGLWTGATNTDWHTTTNWDDGVVPTATVDVTIPNVTNKPVIGSAAVCRALTVQSSSSLTIQSGQTLNVKGNVTLQNSSSFSNSGTLQFSGADCHLSDNRSIKTNLGNITVTD